MLKRANFKDILKKNPHINVEELEEYKALSEELRKAGIQSRGYQLPPPHARKHIKTDSGEDVDDRTVNLNASRH